MLVLMFSLYYIITFYFYLKTKKPAQGGLVITSQIDLMSQMMTWQAHAIFWSSEQVSAYALLV